MSSRVHLKLKPTIESNVPLYVSIVYIVLDVTVVTSLIKE